MSIALEPRNQPPDGAISRMPVGSARLRGGAAPVNALASEFSQSRPAISKHLRVLRDAQLVREERVGRERLYEMNPMPLQRVAGWVEGYRAFWILNLNNLKAHVERR